MAAMQNSDIPGLKCTDGKVRRNYDLGKYLLMVATDRMSAFDYPLQPPIPGKGYVLNTMSAWWFQQLPYPHHMVTTDIDEIIPYLEEAQLTDQLIDQLRYRCMLVKKYPVIPIELIARGQLAGSGHRDYMKNDGQICGLQLSKDLKESARLDPPIFTPSTKAILGEHDENISFQEMVTIVAEQLHLSHEKSLTLCQDLKEQTLLIFAFGQAKLAEANLTLADTKYEFGLDENGKLVVLDELHTPDSSRIWNTASIVEGQETPANDKEFVRSWLLHESGWNKKSGNPPPNLPNEVVQKTSALYINICKQVTGQTSPWMSQVP